MWTKTSTDMDPVGLIFLLINDITQMARTFRTEDNPLIDEFTLREINHLENRLFRIAEERLRPVVKDAILAEHKMSQAEKRSHSLHEKMMSLLEDAETENEKIEILDKYEGEIDKANDEYFDCFQTIGEAFITSLSVSKELHERFQEEADNILKRAEIRLQGGSLN